MLCEVITEYAFITKVFLSIIEHINVFFFIKASFFIKVFLNISKNITGLFPMVRIGSEDYFLSAGNLVIEVFELMFELRT